MINSYIEKSQDRQKGRIMRKENVASFFWGLLIGSVVGGTIIGKMMSKDVIKWQKLSDKNLQLFLLMNKWLKIKHRGNIHIREYFEKEGYKTIAVYGLSHVGERLLEELKDSEVEIKYAIDKNAAGIYLDIEVYSPDDNLPRVDAVVVTAVYFFDEITHNLKDKVTCPIISLEDIMYDMDKL